MIAIESYFCDKRSSDKDKVNHFLKYFLRFEELQ